MHKCNVTEAKPVYSRRFGYSDTGFAFTFHRCLDTDALRKAVAAAPGFKHEPWIDGGDAPVGFTVCSGAPALPGLLPESHNGYLCEVHVFAVACDDRVQELRHWRHEVGHAVDFSKDHLAKIFAAETPGAWLDAVHEYPGPCTEFLCEAADALFTGAAVSSGMPSLFPWLEKKT